MTPAPVFLDREVVLWNLVEGERGHVHGKPLGVITDTAGSQLDAYSYWQSIAVAEDAPMQVALFHGGPWSGSVRWLRDSDRLGGYVLTKKLQSGRRLYTWQEPVQ